MTQKVSKQDMVKQVGSHCWLTGGACSFEVSPGPNTCLLVFPFGGQYMDAVTATRRALDKIGIRAYRLDEFVAPGVLACKVCRLAQQCEFAIVDISENNPNVFFELGLLCGLRRKVLLIRRAETRMPADLLGIDYLEYASFIDLRRQLVQLVPRLLEAETSS